jgi:hypothetical protein
MKRGWLLLILHSRTLDPNELFKTFGVLHKKVGPMCVANRIEHSAGL